MRRPFRVRNDRITVGLDREVLDVLASLPALLNGVGARADDPAAARLTPQAHPGDLAAEAQFRELTAGDLQSERNADRRRFAASLAAARTGGSLDVEHAESWLRVLGEARLVLGARLGIDEDGWERDARDGPEFALLGYLGFLQEELVSSIGRLLFDGG